MIVTIRIVKFTTKLSRARCTPVMRSDMMIHIVIVQSKLVVPVQSHYQSQVAKFVCFAHWVIESVVSPKY